MAITLYKQDGEVLYGVKEFLLDSKEDLNKLTTDIRSGSSALIISTGEIFMLNGKKQWVAVGSQSSNSENENTSYEELLNMIDQDRDGIVDQSEKTSTIEMENF